VSCHLCPLDVVRISSHQPVTPSHCCPVILVRGSATETNLIMLTTKTDTWPGKPVCATPVEKPSKERCHSPYPCPVEQVTTRNGRTGFTRQFIRPGMMATVPQVTERAGRIVPLNSARAKENIKSPDLSIGAFGYFGCLTGAWRHFDSPVGAGSCVLLLTVTLQTWDEGSQAYREESSNTPWHFPPSMQSRLLPRAADAQQP
jgi:hypothetical protein